MTKLNTEITTPAAEMTVNASLNTEAAPAKKPVSSNKDFRAYMATSALDLAMIRDEALERAIEKNPELKVSEASRRAKYGELGMRAECHMKANGLLSGMGNKEMKVLKDMGLTAEFLALDTSNGGISKEAKIYVATIAACVAQQKRPDSIDLTEANKALKELDATAPTKRVGHASVNYLINLLQDVQSWTIAGFMAEAGHDGDTQAGYMFRFLRTVKMAKCEGQANDRKVTPFQDHPVIQGLISIK